MGEPLERVLCGDNSGYGSEAFCACDPRFILRGGKNRASCFGWDACTAFGFAVSLGFAFRRAKTNRDRDLGRLFDSPMRTIVTGVPKAIPVKNSAPDVGAEK